MTEISNLHLHAVNDTNACVVDRARLSLAETAAGEIYALCGVIASATDGRYEPEVTRGLALRARELSEVIFAVVAPDNVKTNELHRRVYGTPMRDAEE